MADAKLDHEFAGLLPTSRGDIEHLVLMQTVTAA